MTRPVTFPSWIVEAVEGHREQMDPKSLDFFKKFVELLPDFDSAFLSIPATTEVGVLTSLDPSEIKKELGLKSPLEFILMNTVEFKHFHFIYQMRELCFSSMSALDEGRFYVAAVLGRAMLEVVCVNYTQFIKAKDKMERGLGYLRQAARTRSEKEKGILLKKYWESIYESFSVTFDANRGASINWSDYMSERFGAKGISSEQTGKLNTVSAVNYMEEKSKLPLNKSYGVFSEFVHPNAGSKMLVVNTKRQHHPIMDALKIGENRQNAEAVLFYFDHLSEGYYYSWTMALSLLEHEQNFIAMLDSMCSAGSSRTTH